MIISHKPVQSIAQVIMKWRISILLALVALNLHSAAQKDDNRMPPGTPNQNTETMTMCSNNIGMAPSIYYTFNNINKLTLTDDCTPTQPTTAKEMKHSPRPVVKY